MSESDAAVHDPQDLRQLAAERATTLAQQLQADHADLLEWKRRRKTAAVDVGIVAVTRAIEAAVRVGSLLPDSQNPDFQAQGE
jgi:hypothetical protein